MNPEKKDGPILIDDGPKETAPKENVSAGGTNTEVKVDKPSLAIPVK